MNRKSRIVKVELFTRDGRREYFFGSLKAIYTELTEEQVGCKLQKLYRAGITTDHCYANDRCIVKYVEVARVPQQKGVKSSV